LQLAMGYTSGVIQSSDTVSCQCLFCLCIDIVLYYVYFCLCCDIFLNKFIFWMLCLDSLAHLPLYW